MQQVMLLLVFLLATLSCQATEEVACVHCGQTNPSHGVSTEPGRPKKPKRDKPGDVNRADKPPRRYSKPDERRSGSPHHVAKWARCGVNARYSAGYVGGGAAYAKLPQFKLAQFKRSLFSRGRPRNSGVSHTQATHTLGTHAEGALAKSSHAEGTWGLDYSGFFKKTNVWLQYTQGRSQGGEGAYETDGEPKFVKKLKSIVGRE